MANDFQYFWILIKIAREEPGKDYLTFYFQPSIPKIKKKQ